MSCIRVLAKEKGMGLKRKEIRDEKGQKGKKESGASGRAGRGESRPGRAAVGTKGTGAGDTASAVSPWF